ncbi:MAG TPA: hypothetical protein DCL43_05340 [Chitinophagaceae bacterium]|nr:hypothetical protein [Chitinophagaceae bacterium]HAN37959.1 hypothetical protein [Chitinophagaceae bacterium]
MYLPKLSIVVAFLLLTVVGVSKIVFQPPKQYRSQSSDTITIKETEVFGLLQTNCFTCHNPDLTVHKRLAPPMFKVREHYLEQDTTLDGFVKSITHFVAAPNDTIALMPGAIRNFGLMPKVNVSSNDVQVIAKYLHATDVASDEWYKRWETFKTKQ